MRFDKMNLFRIPELLLLWLCSSISKINHHGYPQLFINVSVC